MTEEGKMSNAIDEQVERLEKGLWVQCDPMWPGESCALWYVDSHGELVSVLDSDMRRFVDTVCRRIKGIGIYKYNDVARTKPDLIKMLKTAAREWDIYMAAKKKKKNA